jgi:RNA polymerase sigma-70 factor (ECF subfamily)
MRVADDAAVTPDETASERTSTHDEELRAALEAVSSAVFQILRRMGVPMDEIDDAMQAVLVRIVACWTQLYLLSGNELRAYACVVAGGIAVDRRRRSKRQARLVPLEGDVEVEEPGPEDALDHQRALAVLDEILSTIPEERRIVFILFEIEELGEQEIAERMGIPRGTVASRLRKARKEFERAVARRRIADERRGMSR